MPDFPDLPLSDTGPGSHTAIPATTNVTAFLGVFPQGTTQAAVYVSSWSEFEADFGDVTKDSLLATYAVWQFFINGGIGAWIVRLTAARRDAKGTAAPVADGDPEWTPSLFRDAVLTELGATTSDKAGAPSSTPRLDQIAPQVFNVMCVPDAVWLTSADQAMIFKAANAFCRARWAFLIVDPPPPVAAGSVPPLLGGGTPPVTIDDLGTPEHLSKFVDGWGRAFLGVNNSSAAAYYPWVQIPDPGNDDDPRYVPPSGTVAGVYARSDETAGVWRAPAGVTATLQGVTGLADSTLTDEITGDLTSRGINCLRTLPPYGGVVWGARTLAGDDLNNAKFKYVNVRRLVDFIEQTLMQSLDWTVFEPNGPGLWPSIAAEVTSFMSALYASGAFSGATATEAFDVVCDATTTTPEDILRGVVNTAVGFQPVEPAEFVVLNVRVSGLAPGES